MEPFLGPRFGNASSPHRFGQEARAAVEEARLAVSRLVGGEDGDVVFTASGTEAVLTAILGAGRAQERPRHFVTTAIEHPSGLGGAAALEREGWRVTRVLPESNGVVPAARVEAALTPDTILVSILHANNETGVVQPVPEVASLCRERGIRLHVDAVQSAGKLPLDASAWGVDLLSLASHKLGGPKGAAALWRRRGVPLRPLVPGTQEGGLRGGTVDVAAVAGFGTAAELAMRERDDYRNRTGGLRDVLETSLERSVPGASITGRAVARLPNTTHLTFEDDVGPDLVLALDLEGFAVSAGAACRSGANEPSHVLLAMGMSAGRARTAVRISTGMDTRETDLDALVRALAERVTPRERV